MNLDDKRQVLIDRSIATEAEIQLVTDISGYNDETLEAILFSRIGERNFEDYLEEEE